MAARPRPPRLARAVLTDLQRQVRAVVANLPEGAAVALAGGSALIATGVVRRGTEDLDFFAAHPEPVEPLLEALEAALEAEGLKVTRLLAVRTHARLLVESGTDATRVDLATDYRLMPTAQTAEGAVLADRELAADKTLALFGRALARDYIDFQALARRFSLSELCELAAAKDGGFTPSLLADALDFIDERDRVTFGIDDQAYAELVAFAKSAAAQLRELELGPEDLGISLA